MLRRLACSALLLGCSSSAQPASPSLECPIEYEPKGGACVARLDVCGEGELAKIGGGCLPIGARTCGEGFVRSKSSGCAPILPTTSCEPGLMAIPGETVCRPIGECPAGRWGAIVVDADTVYVDASYTGSDADGSEARPFPGVQAALDKAKNWATVAVAAGRYGGNLKLSHPVKLAGVCASKVEIAGDASGFALDITADSEVRGLAVTSPDVAVGVYEKKAVLEKLWIHDAGDRGLDIEDGTWAADVVLRDSLIEGTGQIAVFLQGSKLRVERSVIRDTRATRKSASSEGILARATPETRRTSDLTLWRTVVSGHPTYGVLVNASSATLEDCYVTATRALEGRVTGSLEAHDLDSGLADPKTTLTVRRTVVSDAIGIGIDTLHTKVALEDVTVRAISGDLPAGMFFEESDVAITSTTIEDVVGTGLASSGGAVRAEGLLVRRVALLPRGLSGLGIIGEASPDTLTGQIDVVHTAIMDVHSEGFIAWGATGSIRDSFVTRVLGDRNGAFGDGVGAVMARSTSGELARASLDVQRVVVTDTARVGIVAFAAEVRVQGSLVCSAADMQIVRSFPLESGAVVEGPASIADLGENACGCSAPHLCRAETGGISPVEVPSWK